MAVVDLFSRAKSEYAGKREELRLLLDFARIFVDKLKLVVDETENQRNNKIILHNNDTEEFQPVDFIQVARELYRLRRRREEIFKDDDIFGEPAWDILLDLFIAGESGKLISISSSCIASSVPPTTALRWLKELEKRNLVMRQRDLMDGRRSYIRLSPKGIDLMHKYFSCYTKAVRVQ